MVVDCSNAEGAAEGSPEDVAEPLRGAPLREGVFPDDAGRCEALHEAAGGVFVPLMPVPIMNAGEHSGVEAD